MSKLRQKTRAVSHTWDYSAALSIEKSLMVFFFFFSVGGLVGGKAAYKMPREKIVSGFTEGDRRKGSKTDDRKSEMIETLNGSERSWGGGVGGGVTVEMIIKGKLIGGEGGGEASYETSGPQSPIST